MIKYQAFKILSFFLYTFSVLSGKKNNLRRKLRYIRSFKNKKFHKKFRE